MSKKKVDTEIVTDVQNVIIIETSYDKKLKRLDTKNYKETTENTKKIKLDTIYTIDDIQNFIMKDRKNKGLKL